MTANDLEQPDTCYSDVSNSFARDTVSMIDVFSEPPELEEKEENEPIA